LRTYLLTGRTGVGKSSFINSTFGIEIPTDDYEACTKVVEYYSEKTPFGEVRLIDSPGLAERDSRFDQFYLDNVKEKIAGARLEAILYVTPLNESRFRPEEERTLEKITTHLGSIIWQSSWLILTFAASVSDDRRSEAATRRLDSIGLFLSQLTSGPAQGPRFRGFRQVLLVDNVIPRWNPNCRPILTFFR
jgi:energy-coupling factor transporter ATP-binding protein EcfA2